MMDKNISSQDKAKYNADAVNEYLGTTNVDKIPRNQYGSVSRSRILKELNISPSSISTNVLIRNAFDNFDERIGKDPNIYHVRNADDEVTKSLQKKVKRLEERVAMLKAENESYKREKLGEEWFIDTGRVIIP